MKKFFQIAAFAVVGFIAFTSASLRLDQFYVKVKINDTPVPITECTELIQREQVSSGGTEYWALFHTTNNTFVRPSDVAPLTIQQYIAQNQNVLICPAVRLIVE